MNDDPFDADDLAKQLVDWLDRAQDACEEGGEDAVAPLIDELDDLRRSMVIRGLILRGVDDKRHLTEYLDKHDREVRELRERLERANLLLSTVGIEPV